MLCQTFSTYLSALFSSFLPNFVLFEDIFVEGVSWIRQNITPLDLMYESLIIHVGCWQAEGSNGRMSRWFQPTSTVHKSNWLYSQFYLFNLWTSNYLHLFPVIFPEHQIGSYHICTYCRELQRAAEDRQRKNSTFCSFIAINLFWALCKNDYYK